MKILDSIYKYTRFGSYLQTPLLLITRLFWGVEFVISGLGKFQDIENVKAFFASLGIPEPLFNAFFVASIESICGALLAIGFLSRLVSLPLIVVMSVALATTHTESLATILMDPSTLVKDSAFTFLFASLIILAFGPGKLSLDYLLGRERNS